ncbi:MAG: hypothetical protein ACUVTL_07525 [Thermoproteota archaeon]
MSKYINKPNFLGKKFLFIFNICLLLILIVTQIVPLRKSYAFSQTVYITEQALPAVVLIYSRIDYSGILYIPWLSGAEAFTVTSYVSSMGSGFFVNPNGYLVTNGHVVFCFTSKNFREDSVTKSYIIQDAVYTLLSWYQERYGIMFSHTWK